MKEWRFFMKSFIKKVKKKSKINSTGICDVKIHRTFRPININLCWYLLPLIDIFYKEYLIEKIFGTKKQVKKKNTP